MAITKGRYSYLELHKPHAGIVFDIDKVLIDKKSKFQRITIFENKDYGRVFSLDNMIMLTQKDEFLYHEMLVHVPLFSHPQPQNILIIGGGDMGTAREVLKHKSILRVDMVEIDKEVIEASKKHLPFLTSCARDKRLNLIIGDGLKYVKKTRNTYDIILIDSTDPVGPAVGLFQTKFYRDCQRILKKPGILCTLSLSPFNEPDLVRMIYKNVEKVFRRAFLYWGVVPTYPGAFWSYILGSPHLHPLKNFQRERLRKSSIKTRYYNHKIHKNSFDLPNFIQEIIK